MQLNNAVRPKLAFAVLLTLALMVAGTTAAAAFPGVPSSPRVPPPAPWLGWIAPSGNPAPSLPALPSAPSAPTAPTAPMPRTVSENPSPSLPALPNTPAIPAVPSNPAPKVTTDSPAPTLPALPKTPAVPAEQSRHPCAARYSGAQGDDDIAGRFQRTRSRWDESRTGRLPSGDMPVASRLTPCPLIRNGWAPRGPTGNGGGVPDGG